MQEHDIILSILFKTRPTWERIRRQIAKRIDTNGKRMMSFGRGDYQTLGTQRTKMKLALEKLPKQGYLKSSLGEPLDNGHLCINGYNTFIQEWELI